MASIYQQFIARVEELATAIGNSLQLRGFKPGGTEGQVPVKGAGGDFDWEWGDVSGTGGGFIISDTPPADTSLQWFNSTNGVTYTFYDGAWIAESATLAPSWDAITNKPATFPPTIGSGAGDAVAGNDARLTDSRAPTAHKSTHATGGADALAPSDIGAIPATGGTMTNGTVSGYTETVTAIGSVTTSHTLDIASSTLQSVQLTGNACTFTMPTAAAGKSFLLYVQQVASSTLGTATFTGVDWGVAGTYAVTATVGKCDLLSFVSVPATGGGYKWIGSYQKGFTF